MFKVGIIGCGGIGTAHKNAWMQIPDVKVCAVCDLMSEKAESMAKSVGEDCFCTADAEKFPDDLDAVSVVTPPSSHYAVVKAMLGKGFHVFSEKPLTMSVCEGEELNRLAEEKGKILSVGFKMRYEPIFQEARKYIASVGKINTITTTKLQAYNSRPDGKWVTRTGAMYELSIHDFDLISFLTGLNPQKVLFSRLQHRFDWEKEDAFNIVAEYDHGALAQLQGMYAVSSTFCYRDLTITILGDRGYIRIERPDRIVIHTDEYRVVPVSAAKQSAFVCELTHFKQACQGICENTLTAADAVRMTKFIEEARRINSCGSSAEQR